LALVPSPQAAPHVDSELVMIGVIGSSRRVATVDPDYSRMAIDTAIRSVDVAHGWMLHTVTVTAAPNHRT
jgi:hypothetical protein